MPWRVGGRIAINVYDENNLPVCQCQNEHYARLIVDAVNAMGGKTQDPQTKWSAVQRDDLKTCPFCGTKAIEQARLSSVSSTATQWQIQCGNPFCDVVCRTQVFASRSQAEGVWQSRDGDPS